MRCELSLYVGARVPSRPPHRPRPPPIAFDARETRLPVYFFSLSHTSYAPSLSGRGRARRWGAAAAAARVLAAAAERSPRAASLRCARPFPCSSLSALASSLPDPVFFSGERGLFPTPRLLALHYNPPGGAPPRSPPPRPWPRQGPHVLGLFGCYSWLLLKQVGAQLLSLGLAYPICAWSAGSLGRLVFHLLSPRRQPPRPPLRLSRLSPFLCSPLRGKVEDPQCLCSPLPQKAGDSPTYHLHPCT